MKKLLSFLFFLSVAHLSQAQNWNCFVPGNKQFFTNSNGYLRGTRIDSIQVNGNDTIYYPCRSPRGQMLNSTFDSASGGWLGKNVVKRSNGTFLFNNMWGDTVVINTMANVGDSWIFYDDTSSFHYTATVNSIDTTTVSGVLDSIKIITLTAYDGGNILGGSPFNNFVIKLSKNNGFAEVFDLYTFPYENFNGQSYLDDELFINAVMPFSMQGPDLYSFFGPSFPINSSQLFIQTSYHYPRKNEVFDFDPGDVFGNNVSRGICISQSVNGHYIDSIISKTVISGQTYYTYVGYIHHIPSIIDSSLLIDSTKMPEEYRSPVLYYWERDTSRCYTSAAYGVYEGMLYKYKTGFGVVVFDSFFTCPPYWFYDGYMSYTDSIACSKKNGVYCMSCSTLNVATMENRKEFDAFPNPANSELSLKLPDNNRTTKIELYNLLGQAIYSCQTSKPELTILTSEMPQGLYILKIINENGIVESKKIVIQH